MRPGRHHFFSRSTVTLSSLTSSQVLSSPTRSDRNGDISTTCARKASRPSDFVRSIPPFGMTGAFPEEAPIEHHHQLAGFDMAERVHAVAVLVRHAKPQHVHRRPVVFALKAGFLAHDGMA